MLERLRIEVDIAPAVYRFYAGSTVIQARSPEATIVAIFDGIGSWGSGQEASG